MASRAQFTVRLSADEVRALDRAARALHLDRTSFVRAAALGLSDLVLRRGEPLTLAPSPAAALRAILKKIEA